MRDYFLDANPSYRDIIEPACYLVSLYYKTGCKYVCTRTKTSRLLTIYKFCKMKSNPELFNHYFVSSYYMFIRYLNIFFCMDEYVVWEREGIDNQLEIEDEFTEPKNMPSYYHKILQEANLNLQSLNLLETIFRKFGNYSINDLAAKLNPLQELLPFKNFLDSHEYGLVYMKQEDFFKFLKEMEASPLYTGNPNSSIYIGNEILKFIVDYNKEVDNNIEYGNSKVLKK